MKVDEVGGRFPKSEEYGLTGQIRRASVSTPSNLAEGYVRGSTGEYLQLVLRAFGSAVELETQLVLAREPGFIRGDEFEKMNDLLEEVLKVLNGLIASLRSKLAAKH